MILIKGSRARSKRRPYSGSPNTTGSSTGLLPRRTPPRPSARARRRPRAPTDAVRLAVPALARLSPTFEEPRVSLREMADGELSAELAEAKKAFETANTNWAADPGNFALKEVKLSADLVVEKIKYEIKEAKVEELVAQGKGEDDAQVKEAKAAMLRADLAVKEIKYEICAAKVDALVTQGKGEDDAQVKEAKAARDDARDERSKASARLDEFTKSASTPRGASPPSRRSRIPLVTNT